MSTRDPFAFTLTGSQWDAFDRLTAAYAVTEGVARR